MLSVTTNNPKDCRILSKNRHSRQISKIV